MPTRRSLPFGFVLALSACQSSGGKEIQSVQLPPDKVAPAETSTEFWSPERKKANASYYYLAGEYDLMSRNAEGAAKNFDTAYKLEPNAFVASKLVDAKALSNIEEGLELAKKMSLLYPYNSDIQLTYGRLLVTKGEYKQAEEHFRLALKMRPESLESSLMLIQTLQVLEKKDEAIRAAETMTKSSPDFVEGWALLAKLYIEAGQFKKAVNPARKAYDLNNQDPEKVHIYAVALLLDKQVKLALPYFDQLIRGDFFSDEAIERMLRLYQEAKGKADFLTVFRKAHKDSGKKSDGLGFQIAVLEWQSDNFKDSSQSLAELVSHNPENEKLRYLLALNQEKNQQTDEALKTYATFQPTAELYTVSRVRAFELLKREGRNDEALQLVEAAVIAKPDESAVYYSMAAGLLSGQGKDDEAIAMADRGIKANPDNVELIFSKAVFLEKKKDMSGAVAVLREVIKKDPRHSSALNYLGYMFAERGENLEEAEQLIRRALAEKPDSGYYLDSLGWVYYQQKRYKEAVGILERAVQLANGDATIAEHLGDAYAATGDFTRAKIAYKIALEGFKDDKDRERVRAKHELSEGKSH